MPQLTAASTPYRAGVQACLRQDDQLSLGFWIVSSEETPGPVSITLETDRMVLVVEGAIEYAVTGGPTCRLGVGEASPFTTGGLEGGHDQSAYVVGIPAMAFRYNALRAEGPSQ